MVDSDSDQYILSLWNPHDKLWIPPLKESSWNTAWLTCLLISCASWWYDNYMYFVKKYITYSRISYNSFEINTFLETLISLGQVYYFIQFSIMFFNIMLVNKYGEWHGVGWVASEVLTFLIKALFFPIQMTIRTTENITRSKYRSFLICVN